MLSFVRNYSIELVFLLLIAGIYLLNLNLLTLDTGAELYNVQSAREMLQTAHWIIPHFNGQPFFQGGPMLAWLSAMGMGLGGDLLMGARLIAVLLALCCIVLTYLLSATMFKSRPKAILSALILATTGGFFKLSHHATLDLLYTCLLLAFFVMVQVGLSTTSRRKPSRQTPEVPALSIAMGLVLAAMFLSWGLFGVLLPLAILLAFLFQLGALQNLKALNFRLLLAAFLTLGTPWLIVAGLLHGSPEPITTLLEAPLLTAAWESADWEPLFHLKNIWMTLLPWLFFIAALIFDQEQQRTLKEAHRDTLTLLGSWLLSGFMAISLMMLPEPTKILPVLPPLAILAGLYAGHYTETSVFSNAVRWALDLGIMTILLGAVGTSLLFFQVLPDTYAEEFWHLPGVPVFKKTVQDVQLMFPIWKLWLIPGPLILLIGALVLYLGRLWERSLWVVVTLALTFLAFFSFLKGIYLPIIHRPVIQNAAEALNQLPNRDSAHVILYDSSQDIAGALFYLHPDLLPATLLLNNDIAGLEEAIHKRSQTAEERTFGLITDLDYYRIDPETRRYLRIEHSNWLWDAAQQREFYKLLQNIEPNFDKMTYRVLLYEVLPQEAVEASQDPALENENLLAPIDTSFEG